MSRIGKLPVALPSGVDLKVEEGVVRVKGSKGQLEQAMAPLTRIEVRDGSAVVIRDGDSKRARAMHGLMRSLLFNMVKGVSSGFERALDIVGVGYRAEVKGRELVISAGYSHPVVMEIPDDLQVAATTPTHLIVKGTDKQRVGQFAAEIRRIRKPEPYKGKGIRYSDEKVRRKVGKAGAGGKG